MPTGMCRIFLGRKHGLKPITRKADDGTIALLDCFDSASQQIAEELPGQTVGTSGNQLL
jgi:hypothetical protein